MYPIFIFTLQQFFILFARIVGFHMNKQIIFFIFLVTRLQPTPTTEVTIILDHAFGFTLQIFH